MTSRNTPDPRPRALSGFTAEPLVLTAGTTDEDVSRAQRALVRELSAEGWARPSRGLAPRVSFSMQDSAKLCREAGLPHRVLSTAWADGGAPRGRPQLWCPEWVRGLLALYYNVPLSRVASALKVLAAEPELAEAALALGRLKDAPTARALVRARMKALAPKPPAPPRGGGKRGRKGAAPPESAPDPPAAPEGPSAGPL